jgi:hypothetical protein
MEKKKTAKKKQPQDCHRKHEQSCMECSYSKFDMRNRACHNMERPAQPLLEGQKKKSHRLGVVIREITPAMSE